jgi:hypothetical protein
MENYYQQKYNEAHQKLLVAISALAGISEAKYTSVGNKETLNRLSEKAQIALDEIMKPSEVKP